MVRFDAPPVSFAGLRAAQWIDCPVRKLQLFRVNAQSAQPRRTLLGAVFGLLGALPFLFDTLFGLLGALNRMTGLQLSPPWTD